jgi:hypothetical protein
MKMRKNSMFPASQQLDLHHLDPLRRTNPLRDFADLSRWQLPWYTRAYTFRRPTNKKVGFRPLFISTFS